MSTARPIHVAEAIIEAARETVTDAHRYQSAWGSLTAAGVPRLDTRHVLDRKAQATEALGHVERWSHGGARGLLGLAGERGAGKTFAAAWWLHHRHLRGKWSRWVECASWGRLDFRELRTLLTAAEKAPALVLDDLTAGSGTNDMFRNSINGLILERIGAMRPTLICSNGSAASLLGWLDPRVFDRLNYAGAIPELPEVASLRKPDHEEVDELGRGVEWHRTDKIVRLFGVEETRRFVEPAKGAARDDHGHYVDHLDIGRALLRAAQMRNYEPCTEAIEIAGLDRVAIHARALKIGGSDSRTKLEATLAKALRNLAATTSTRRRKDNEVRSKKCYDAMAEGRARVHRPAMASVVKVTVMDWTKGEEGQHALREAGFKVEGKPGVMRVLYGTTIKATGLPSKAAAWDRAREIASMGW